MERTKQFEMSTDNIIIQQAPEKLEGEILLPSSKSISNRVLMIQTLSKKAFRIENLSDAQDTKLMEFLLCKIHEGGDNSEMFIDCKDAGTVARFLMSYLAFIKHGSFLLDGTERLRTRPMADLINVLRELGAYIECLDNEGFLPLKIKTEKCLKNNVFVNCSESSQFVSSLLLVAPLLPDGLDIRLSDVQASKPFIDMTISLMNYYGVQVLQNGNHIKVVPQEYVAKDIFIESDWSSAAYWYNMAAISVDCSLKLTALSKNSIQGDSVLAKIYEDFGVHTVYEETGVLLKKSTKNNDFFKFDFLHTPDLFPSVLLTCVLTARSAHLTGLLNLQFKESDRFLAMLNLLRYIGFNMHADMCKSEIIIGKQQIKLPSKTYIKTYKDHRIAMAFASLVLKNVEVEIEDCHVISKSYPAFWGHLNTLGFKTKPKY